MLQETVSLREVLASLRRELADAQRALAEPGQPSLLRLERAELELTMSVGRATTRAGGADPGELVLSVVESGQDAPGSELSHRIKLVLLVQASEAMPAGAAPRPPAAAGAPRAQTPGGGSHDTARPGRPPQGSHRSGFRGGTKPSGKGGKGAPSSSRRPR